MGATLSLLGWQPLDDETMEILTRHDKMIMVYPHTSRYDFLLYVAYASYHPIFRERCKVLINPYYMSLFGSLLKPLGGIEATAREVKGGRATDRIYETLSNLERYIFLVSPKGSMAPNPWRSGFYHLASKLDCHIMAAGFDYEKKRFITTEPFKVGSMSFEEVAALCKERMRDITPLYPDHSEFDIEAHKREVHPSLATKERYYLFLFICLMLLLLLVWLIVSRCGWLPSARNSLLLKG